MFDVANDGLEISVIKFFRENPEGTEFGMFPPPAARFVSGAKCGQCQEEVGHSPANAHQSGEPA